MYLTYTHLYIVGHGFKLAPIVGKILSELALGQTPSYDLSPFKIQQAYTVSYHVGYKYKPSL